MKAYVVTSIRPPNDNIAALVQLAGQSGDLVIVVGDLKTPHAAYSNFRGKYISPEEQESRWPRLARMIPWNCYARKVLGYIFAAESGADVIVETDDDNHPLEGFGTDPVGVIRGVSAAPWLNPFMCLSAPQVAGGSRYCWPRGFPLEYVLEASMPREEGTVSAARVAVWQGMTAGDPDVDSIYRLTNNVPVEYNGNGPIAIVAGSWCPFNSQNTMWKRDSFDLMYLPSRVPFRETDIIRSFVAQQQLWEREQLMGYTGPTTFSARNPHDLLQDFEQEVEMFKHTLRVVKCLEGSPDIHDAYGRLAELGVASGEQELLDEWLTYWK